MTTTNGLDTKADQRRIDKSKVPEWPPSLDKERGTHWDLTVNDFQGTFPSLGYHQADGPDASRSGTNGMEVRKVVALRT